MAGIGALQPGIPQPSAAQVGATAPIGLPNSAGQQTTANIGFALGGLQDAYKNAQLQDLERQTALTKMGRDRLAQIWEIGVKNPQIQSDPRVHQQVQSLYKQMGLPTPIDPSTGQIDWNQLQPVKQFSDLKDPMIQHLMQMPTPQRKAVMHAMNIVGADPGFEEAPAVWTPAQLTKMNTDLANIQRDLGDPKKGMTAEAFAQWVDANKVGLNQQAGDPNYADSMLNNGKLFEQFANASVQRMQKLAEDTSLDAAKRKEIAADIQGIHDLGSLRQAEAKWLKVKTDAYPAVIQQSMARMAASAQRDTAAAALAQATVVKIQANQATNPPEMQTLLRSQASAMQSYQEAVRTMNAALGPNGGGITPELQEAYNTAKQNYDSITAALKTLKTPAMQSKIQALKTGNVSGYKVNPVGPGTAPQGMTTYAPSGTFKFPDGKVVTGPVMVDNNNNYYINGRQLPK